MFKLLLAASVDICDLYLFHSISLVNPDFKLVNSLISSSLDKVTTGIYNLQSFLASVAPVGAPSLIGGLFSSIALRSTLVITQFLFHLHSKDTSQLINGMFNALQKLPKYFNGIANSIVFVPFLFVSKPAAPAATLYVLPIILFLYLKVFELTILMLLKTLSAGILSLVNSSL